MHKLLLDGAGILGKEDGVSQRKLLALDTHDYSLEPVSIIFSRHVKGISQRFCLAFLWASVYRTYNNEIPFSQNNAPQIYDDHKFNTPFIIGPYSFHPEGGEMTVAFSLIQHTLGGALWGLCGYHARHFKKGKDSLTPLLQ